MEWDRELTALIRRAQASHPDTRDALVMMVLCRLREACLNGRESALAEHCLTFNAFRTETPTERTVA